MRDDMFKVIVERPRLVNSNGYSRDGRKYRNQEDAPVHLGMKKGYESRKYFNENLRPLKRYLESQVSRPWDKVHSEICATIDVRSTVKQHVLQHLFGMVVLNARWEENAKGGRVLVPSYSKREPRYIPLHESSELLYVHPVSGLLLRNKAYKSRSARVRDERKVQQVALQSERRVVSEFVQLHCIDGIWFEVALKNVPRYNCRIHYDPRLDSFVPTDGWDVVLKISVMDNARSRSMADLASVLQRKYGNWRIYAASKRQLSLKELKKYGLKNKAQSGLIFLPQVSHCNTASLATRYPFPVTSHFPSRDPDCAQLPAFTLRTPCHVASTICHPC